MPMSQILLDQLTDPFRIVLLFGLVYTMYRTRPQTGTAIPLAAGIVFVAAIIPMTLGQGAGSDRFLTEFGVGLLANAVIVAIVFGLWQIVRHLRR
ncbi:MAG: hypothetical protein IAE87_01715 [Rhodobacteraceae bacterium]|nr:hypothetical protein [Paracoccaceae bacterium]